AAVVHAPGQAHQRSIDRLPAPVGDESAAERCIERNLQFVHGRRTLGDRGKIDALDGAPTDQTEALDEDTVLVGADRWSRGFQQREVVVGEAGRRYGEHQPVPTAADPRRGEEYRGHRRRDVNGKIGVVALVGDRISTCASLVHGGTPQCTMRCAIRGNPRGFEHIEAQLAPNNYMYSHSMTYEGEP